MAITNYSPISIYGNIADLTQAQIKARTLKFYQDEVFFTKTDPSTGEVHNYNFIAPARNRHVFGVLMDDDIHDIFQSPNYTYSDPAIIEYDNIIIENIGKLIWEAM